MTTIKGWKGTWSAKIDAGVSSELESLNFTLERTGADFVGSVSIDLTGESKKSGDSYLVPFPVKKGSVVEIDIPIKEAGHTVFASVNLDPATGKSAASFRRPFTL